MIIYSIVAGGTVAMAHLFIGGHHPALLLGPGSHAVDLHADFPASHQGVRHRSGALCIIMVGNPRIGRLVGATVVVGCAIGRQHGAAPGQHGKGRGGDRIAA